MRSTTILIVVGCIATGCATAPPAPDAVREREAPSDAQATLSTDAQTTLPPVEAFQLAKAHYESDRCGDAIPLFEDIAMNADAPPDLRVYSANLHLDCLNQLKRYDELGSAAERYLGAGLDNEELRRTLMTILVQAELTRCHALEESKAFVESGECFLAVAQEQYNSDLDAAPMPATFWNAAIMFDLANEPQRALDVRLEQLRLFSGGPDAHRLMFAIAAGYEELGNRDEALKFYRLVARNHPTTKVGQQAAAALSRLE